MKQTTLKFAGVALAIAFAAVTAKADVAIHQNVSVYGYAAGSVSYQKNSLVDNDADRPDKSDTAMDIDAAKLGFAFNFAPVTAKLSFYTDAGASDIYVLEANATYDMGNGLSLTGGRFQSWIGYEAFDIPNANFITNGFAQAPIFGAGIPNFHEGIRVDYNFDKMSVGLAIVDSVYTADTFNLFAIEGRLTGDGFDAVKYRGDGELSDGYGVEGHFGYNDGALSIGATIAYQNNRKVADMVGERYIPKSDVYVGDVWAQYIIKNTTIGAELFYSQTKFDLDIGFYGLRDSVKSKVFYGLVMVKQQLSEKFSVAGRFSAGQEKIEDFKGSFWKVSATPGYAITQNLSVCAEVSYTKYNKDSKELSNVKNNVFAGVQAVFKF